MESPLGTRYNYYACPLDQPAYFHMTAFYSLSNGCSVNYKKCLGYGIGISHGVQQYLLYSFHQMSYVQIAYDVPDTPDKSVCDMVASKSVWRFFYAISLLTHSKIAPTTFTSITLNKTTVKSTSSQNAGQTKEYHLCIILVLFQRQHLTWLDFYLLFNPLNPYLGFFAPPP